MRASHFLLPILLASTALSAPTVSHAQIVLGVSITIAPPMLPVYAQPAIPAEGYLWTPGYWAYGDAGYFWVPGTWVQPPSVGVLWTPGYWGWNNGTYLFNAGYWGPTVGFYGGVNYGFGYGGNGYQGGRWDNGRFAYNSAVNNFGGTHVASVYRAEIADNNNRSRVSFNGGTGGLAARPTAQEEAAAHRQHVAATPQQVAHVQAAQGDHTLLNSVNHGNPAVAATARPVEPKAPAAAQAKAVEPPAAGHVAEQPARPPLAAATASHEPGTSVGGAPHPATAAAKPEVAKPEVARTEVAKPAVVAKAPTPIRPAEPAKTSAAQAPAAPHVQAAAKPAAPHPQAQAAARPAAPAHAAPAPHTAVAAHPPEAPQKRPEG